MKNSLFHERYARQTMLPEFGTAGQQKLAQASVLLVGVGGLGSTIAQLLCACGIGRLTLVDADTVSLSNLQRQILYRSDEIGQSKIRCAVKNLKRLNPEVEISGIEARFSQKNALELAQGCHLIVDGSDNAEARYLMNDVAVGFGIPYVYGGISEFSGQVAVFNRRASDATYRCVFPQPEEMPQTVPAGVIGTLPAFIASIQANECIKLLSGCGSCLDNQLFCCNLQNMQTACLELQASETGRSVSLENFKRLEAHKS